MRGSPPSPPACGAALPGAAFAPPIVGKATPTHISKQTSPTQRRKLFPFAILSFILSLIIMHPKPNPYNFLRNPPTTPLRSKLPPTTDYRPNNSQLNLQTIL